MGFSEGREGDNSRPRVRAPCALRMPRVCEGGEGAWGAEAFEAWLRRDSALALTAFKAGRLAEAVAARACGGDTARGGELLTDIAAGEDRGWPPGSKPDKIARRIRAQLGALLGGHAPAAALLRALTQDGRLHPGLSDALGDVLSWDE